MLCVNLNGLKNLLFRGCHFYRSGH